MSRNACLLIALVVWLAACGGPRDAAQDQPAAESESESVSRAFGTIEGRVTFEGDVVPENEFIDMTADPNCASAHAVPVTTQNVIVGTNGGLQNTFVYIKEGIDGSRYSIPATPVTVEEFGCMYQPRVLGVRVGQPLRFANRDETLHNVHELRQNAPQFGIGQPLVGLVQEFIFDRPEVMVPFRCDVHRWMSGYVGVVDHPFYVVTGAEGHFVLKDVPTGEYVIEVWHETFGLQHRRVTVNSDEVSSMDFEFSG